MANIVKIRKKNYDYSMMMTIYPRLDDCDVKNENGEYVKLGHSQFHIALLWRCHCYWKSCCWIVCVHIPLFYCFIISIFFFQVFFKWGRRGRRAVLISTSVCIDIKRVCKSIDFQEQSQYRRVILPLPVLLPVNRLKIWDFFFLRQIIKQFGVVCWRERGI